jgi:site-specific DNA-methyltransferase (adenine-specific)
MSEIICGNSLDLMYRHKQIPADSIDLLLTDPPYWTLNKWRDVGTTTRLGGNHDKSKQTGWFTTIDEQELFDFMCSACEVLKPDRHAAIFCDGQTLKWVLGYAEEAGFSYCKPLVWDKMAPGMGYHFRNQHEFMVLLDKGKNRHPHDLGMPDVFRVSPVRGGYPTEKPVALMRMLIEQLTEPGEMVLDPFCGSGSVCVAARDTKREYLGIDISQEAVTLTEKRLAAPIERDLFQLLEA